MGIHGLLPFIRKVWQETDLSQFAGTTVAVDIYCWLHKGAFTCAEALALNKPTIQYVYYCEKLMKLLLRFRLKPILVFDGRNLPSKSAVEEKRREQRESNRRRAARCLAEGNKAEARECFERSIDVTPEMALRVMEAAHKLNVDCIVAPYESDAQIAFLCQRGGIADMAISEDSDLLPFGCERVFFKLDINSGRGILIERERLLAEGFPINGGLSGDRFRHMCLLAGCDYYPGVSGVGLTTAAKVMSRTRLGDLPSLLSKLRMYLPKNESANLSPDEKESLLRAERTFLHQVVFDPLRKRQVPLTPHPHCLSTDDLLFAGKIEKDERFALQLALGNVNPESGETVKAFSPKHVTDIGKPRYLLSIWDPNYKPRAGSQRGLTVKTDILSEKSPEGQTGRDKVVRVTYHPPAVSSKKITPGSSTHQSKEDEKTEAFKLFSQYFTQQTSIDASSDGDKSNKAVAASPEDLTPTDCDADNSSIKAADCNLSLSPVSPVFHRSHNRFAVDSSTSGFENSLLSSRQAPQRPRFSLDQGLSSINYTHEPCTGDAETVVDALDQFSSSPTKIKSPALCSPIVSKKRPLSHDNDLRMKGKRAKFSKTSSAPQNRSKPSLMSWCRSAPTLKDGSHQENEKPSTSKFSVAFSKKSNDLMSKVVKATTVQQPYKSSNNLVGQIMSLWKKPDKEKLVISVRECDDVIDLE